MNGLESNVFDTALIFEGGGMRESYTSAVANTLLENGVFFDQVYGVSAGSSNAVNYLSRDSDRVYRSFTTIVEDPDFGDMKTFLQHKGMFNAQLIYMEMGKPDGLLPFDMETYLANPAKATICGFQRDTGKTAYWTKDDMSQLEQLMLRVRASSTLPIVMPPPIVDGRCCYDGGLAEGNGIMLPKAQRDGFKKFFIVRTRPKGFRKPIAANPLFKTLFWRRPIMRGALDAWGPGYNAICDEIDGLVAAGSAYCVYADQMSAENSTRDLDVLKANYEAGYRQSQRELPQWREFLEL